MRIRAALLVAGCAATVALPAGADEVDDLGKKVLDIETKANELNASFRPPAGPTADMADRRLIDAQLLYQLKNYEHAAILLTDVVDHYPGTRAYNEALFLLADCLYQKRELLSARRAFEKVVERGPGQPGSQDQKHYQEALQRLIELALRTGDFGPVEGHLQKLHAVPAAQLQPSVPY